MTDYLLDANHLSPLVTITHPLRKQVLQRQQMGDTFALAVPALTEVLFGIGLLPRARQNLADSYILASTNDCKHDWQKRNNPSYVPPFKLGQVLQGGCVGRVVQSKGGKFQVDDYVLGIRGWREYYVSDGSELTKIEPNIAPIQAYLGTTGMPGLTAYVGLLDIGQPQEGDTVFGPAASGAVGAIVCQIAKIKGCRVVGSAGSDEKIAWLLNEAGVDAAFNYKQVGNLTAELGQHCPKGIDVYFENVGGQHLEAALEHMNPFGRIVLCGLISQYNATEPPPGPSNLGLAVLKRLLLKGFIVTDHADRRPQFYADMGKWIAEGRIKWKETVVEGIENAPKAFIGLFKGENFGKMLVKIGPDPAA